MEAPIRRKPKFREVLRFLKKISEKGLTMREWRVRIPKFADEPGHRGDGRDAGNGVYLVN